MTNLTNTAETRTLQWLLGQATTAVALPLTVGLLTALGSDATAGTEVVGGTYTRQELDAAAVADGASTSSTLMRWEGIPADLGPGGGDTEIVGVEIWDDDGVRWWHGELDEPKTVVDGVLEIPIGDLALALD
nr:hypothetical protein [Micromonospora sp. DSM 115978]